MKSVLLALLVALGLGVGLGTNANAYPNEGPLSDSREDLFVKVAMAVADQTWAQHGIRPPCKAELFLYDSRDASVAVADVTDRELGMVGCRVGFDRDYRSYLLRIFDGRQYPLYLRRAAFAVMCGIATHEEGHRIGFKSHGQYHSPYPWNIMYPTATGRVIPANCIRWAVRLVPVGLRLNKTKRVSLGAFSTK